MTESAHTVARAVPELLDLATAVRSDWPYDEVQAVILAAHSAGLTWPQVLVGMARLLVDPAARPQELVPNHRDQRARRAGTAPTAEYLAARKAIARDGDHE
ncbi:hypothetical protein SAMN05421505_14911 [Sinosporangium album]|uniref:Uncharacterized protein n=1 Tax=Sinosporangium album TaxID=504805 RepID=A0A1G8KAW6_9ACTN|nr:hypothetical protein [Sinosporangium album]SDI40561.1 hypothetical protein SAMN05421505_14911 [Sinosporangium album]